jgi:hypothetical protein
MKRNKEDSFSKAWKSVFLDPFVPVFWGLLGVGILLGAVVALLLMAVF